MRCDDQNGPDSENDPLPDTFPIKPLSELGSFRSESDMRGLTALLILLAVAAHSCQDEYEERLAELRKRVRRSVGGKQKLVIFRISGRHMTGRE